MRSCSWFSIVVELLLACAGCNLGTKSACSTDSDCFDGLSCIAGTCIRCAADRAGCVCENGECLLGMVCSAQDVCVDCSDTDPCGDGLACEDGRCVACDWDLAGCPCDAGRCRRGLVCGEADRCEVLACGDGVRNGDEIDVDCGGSCDPCGEGARCVWGTDCESLSCDEGTCLAIGSCIVPTDAFPTIQSAVGDPRCTAILVGEGLFEEQVRIERPIEMKGIPDDRARSSGTILSSGSQGPTIEIVQGPGTVVLRHLRIENGSALLGAGVLSRRDVIVEDSRFVGNRASVNATTEEENHPCGGAIFVEDANLTVRDSVFVENSAEQSRYQVQRTSVNAYGGAICIFGDGTLLIESSEFRRNLAAIMVDIAAGGPLGPRDGSSWAFGGAIHRSEESVSVIRDSIFVENVARASAVAGDSERRLSLSRGGAISVSDELFSGVDTSRSTVIEGCLFQGNMSDAVGAGAGSLGATAEGGAVVLKSAVIRDTTFEHNWALAVHPTEYSNANGGAARLRTARLESTRFWRNRVDADVSVGGALQVLDPSTIVNTVFWDNYAAGASAISVSPTGIASHWLVNSTLVDNGPGPQLGGGGSLTLKHSVLAGGHESCYGDVLSAGYNVFEQSDCFVAVATETDRLVRAPLVENVYNRSAGPRAVSVHRDSSLFSEPGFPLIGSPVIDGGDPTGCRDEEDDEIRVDNSGHDRQGPCDIGAFAFSPDGSTRRPLRALLLTKVSPEAPPFFAPDEGDCKNAVTAELAAIMKESIAGDVDALPTAACDGLIDKPVVLILEREGEPYGLSALMSTECVSTHLACKDPIGDTALTGQVDYHIRFQEACGGGGDSASVSPGLHGCIEASVDNLHFDIGFLFRLSNAQLVGVVEALPTRISQGLITGFLPLSYASESRIPDAFQAALGGATMLSDLLCPADLVERNGVLGVPVEFGVEFEAVTLYGLGLPPVRPINCE